MSLLLEGQQTDRILFRRVQHTDYNQWLPFFQDPITFLHWVEPRKSPEDACEKWIQKQLHRYENNLGGMNALIERQSGDLLGYCGLLVQSVDGVEELEVGYSLLPRFWKNGYASEAAIKCRNYAFERNLSGSLISIISVTNEPSKRVAHNNGMKCEKTTTYRDNKVDIFRITGMEWEQLSAFGQI